MGRKKKKKINSWTAQFNFTATKAKLLVGNAAVLVVQMFFPGGGLLRSDRQTAASGKPSELRTPITAAQM